MVNREAAPTPEGRQVSARMHIPGRTGRAQPPGHEHRPHHGRRPADRRHRRFPGPDNAPSRASPRPKVMTLYRYVPSKDALLDGVVARVLTDLAINPAAADWRQELRDLATFRGLAPAHPNAVPLLVTRATHQRSRATARTRRRSPRRASAGPGFRPVRRGKVDSVNLICKFIV